jgi:predicted transcriptional regulator
MPSSKAGAGDLERAVLDVLWDQQPDQWATVRSVHAELVEQRDLAYTTVMTVMDRLARKDLVEQRRDGRAYLYRARASRGEMTADMMRATLDDLGSGDRPAALVAFVEDASAEDVAALRAALDRLTNSS